MREYCVGTEGIRCCPMATKLAYPNCGDDMQPNGGAVWRRSIFAGGHEAITERDHGDVRGGTFLAWGKLRFRVYDEWTPDYYGSYGLNNWLYVPDDDKSFVLGGPSRKHTANYWKAVDVRKAGHIPMLLDSWWWCSWVKDADTPPEHEGQITCFPCGCQNSIHRFCINRHAGSVNAAFLDCSVRKVGLKELWALKWHRQFDTAGPWTPAGGVKPDDWPRWMRHFKDY